MINDRIKNLQNQISALENKIKKFEKNSQTIINNSGFTVWNKILLNINIIDKKTIQIKKFENKSKNHLFFQLNVKFFNYSSQDIKFDLCCDNILIGSNSNSFENGLFEISIYGTYQNSILDNIDTELFIDPKNNKQVTILGTSLTIWGISQEFSNEFDAIQTNNYYILSYISNNRLYCKKFITNLDSNEFDFEFLDEAISHSFCKTSYNSIYLFRVDSSGNLFFGKFLDSQEVFIAKNVSKVSSCFFNNSIYFSYISNNECYFGEVINDIVISNNKISLLFGKFNNCYLYADNINNKCYMILSKENGSNYLLENIKDNHCSSENILATIELTISTSQEGEL